MTTRATSAWAKAGRCIRGHDLSDPGVVAEYGSSRHCKICRQERDRNYKAKLRAKRPMFDTCAKCGESKTRTTDRFCSHRCRLTYNPGTPREFVPSNAVQECALDLFRRSESAMPWDREQLKAKARALLEGRARLPEPPAAKRVTAAAKAKVGRLARRQRALAGRGDGGADSVDRDTAPLGDGGDGCPVRPRDGAVAEAAQLGRGHSDGVGSVRQGHAGAGRVEEVVEGLATGHQTGG